MTMPAVVLNESDTSNLRFVRLYLWTRKLIHENFVLAQLGFFDVYALSEKFDIHYRSPAWEIFLPEDLVAQWYGLFL